MIVFALFGPLLCVVVPLVALVIAMIVYVMAHYCISLPLSRNSHQGEGEAATMMKMDSSEEAAEKLEDREGK